VRKPSTDAPRRRRRWPWVTSGVVVALAATAVILAATYPDIFATATSVAGGEYGLNQVDFDDPGATPPAYHRAPGLVADG
jgi:hypothetical protein